MNERKIIIFTALEIERRAAERAVKHVARASRPCSTPQDTGRTSVPRGEDNPARIEIITIGIRAVRDSAWQSALRSAPQSGGTCIVLAGLGGGLDPTLRVGDVVIDAVGDRGLQGLPFRFGRIHTSAGLACTPEAKSRLFQSTGALAVDMETALIRKVAIERGMPIIGVRAISDTADAAIDPRLISLVDELGRPKPAKLTLAILRDPRLAISLARLGRDTRRALHRLEVAIQGIVEKLNETNSRP